MINKRFNYLIWIAFFIGTILLIIVQFNSSKNLNKLLKGNGNLLRELKVSNHLREIDRDILGAESRIRAAIATNDTSHLEGVSEKIKEVKTYLDSLKTGIHDADTKLCFDRLSILAEEKAKTSNHLLDRFHKLGNMHDTTSIGNPQARITSDEITRVTRQIYRNRQVVMNGISMENAESGRKASLYGNILITLLLFSAGVLCLFIIRQFRGQNELISKLHISEKNAREAAQIKENFLANMSHEIRTPLNSILGFTNLLKRRNMDEDSVEFVDSIQKAGENLLAIINDILDLSKIEAGMMRIVSTPFSVRGLLHSLETLFGERVKEKGLELYSETAQDVPDTLIGDATRLTQILVNLIGNALKFSDTGTIKIKVYTKSQDGDSIQLGIKVSDSGIGIDKKKLTEIFDRFNQAEDSITRSYGGTGLGLSIVKNLVSLQNGNIEVSSEPGKGTEFNFYIPYIISDEQITDIPLHADLLHDEMKYAVSILVVDDNAMNQSLMKHLLMQWNFTFDIVSNGLQAIDALRNDYYDLILMDIQMPEMDGYTATHHIRTDLHSHVPIIAMTAHAMAGEREKCISHGMNEYISKPINEEILFKLITKFVVHHESVKPSLSGADALSWNHYRVIDLTYMKDISKGNQNYEKLVTAQFIDCIPEDISAIEDAYKNDNCYEINKIAHNLKTSVAIMGLLPVLAEPLDRLENMDKVCGDIEPILDNLKETCLLALREAKDFYSTF